MCVCGCVRLATWTPSRFHFPTFLLHHQGSVKIFAKDLVRTKHSIQKFHQMGAQLRALEIRITVGVE